MSENEEFESVFAMLGDMEGFYRVAKIRETFPRLDQSLVDFDLLNGAATLAGLMLLPQLQANTIRLEALSHLFCLRAAGRQPVLRKHLLTWLNDDLGQSPLCQLEDPSPDVFVSNVMTSRGNRRLFQGMWIHADYAVQEFVDILQSAPSRVGLGQLSSEVQAILSLSELLATRIGLPRYSAAESTPSNQIEIPHSQRLLELAGIVKFSHQDLQSAQISTDLLAPFVLREENRGNLANESIGHSSLERCCLLPDDNSFIFAQPSAVGAAIRRHVLESISTLGFLHNFSDVLRKKQRYDLTKTALGLGKWRLNPLKLLPLSQITEEWLFETVVPFDEGKLAHVILLHDDPGQVLQDGLTGHTKWPAGIAEQLSKHLQASAEALLAKSGVRAGLTVVVLGGIGRGFQLSLPKPTGSWGVSVWTLADLINLSWTNPEWLLECWKLRTQLAALEQRGTTFSISTEDVDLFAYWKHERWRLLPLEFSFGSPGFISIFPDFVQGFRQWGRESYDLHAVFKPDEKVWVTVRKKMMESYFKGAAGSLVYVSPQHLERGVLCAVVEKTGSAWWLECSPPNGDHSERQLQYHLWEGATSWLAELTNVFDPRAHDLPKASFTLRLDLDGLKGFTSTDQLADLSEDGPIETRVDAQAKLAVIRLNPGFLRLLTRPENEAEQALVQALAEVLQSFFGQPLNKNLADFLRTVAANPAMRYIHAFPARTARDVLSELATTEGRFVQDQDLRFSALGTACMVACVEGRNALQGEQECHDFLHSIVDARWHRIREQLKPIDRRSLVEKCFRNMESLTLDHEQWKRTASALFAVHQDPKDVLQAAEKRQRQRDRAQTATRALLEMAVSTCPAAGGNKSGNAELDALVAEVLLMISAAHEADSVHFRLTKPEIKLWPNGEYTLEDTSLERIVKPYQTGILSNQYESHAAGYADLYGTKSTLRSSEELFGSDFLHAFEAEYGIPVDQLVRAEGALQDFAVCGQTAVVWMSRRAFEDLLTTEANLSAAQVENLLSKFALSPRESWDATPHGYRKKDWYPWRFRRRLSLLSRPLVQLGTMPDNEIAYAPSFLHDALGYVVEGAFYGRFDQEYFSSSAMRSWAGRVKDRDGHALNNRVASKFREIGFHSRPSVKMSEFNVPGKLGDYGDLDVLAWADDGTVYLVECKNLQFAMTVGEIAEQLSKFRGEAGDELSRHLRRCTWLSENPAELEKVTKTKLQGRAPIPLLVLNTIAPMQFKEGLPLSTDRIVAFSDLDAKIQKP